MVETFPIRFNIEYDDILREEVNGMSTIGQDSYDWGFTEGKAEGILESASNTVVSLVQNEGWALEKAMSVTGIPDELKGRLEEEVGKRLN